MQIYYCYKIMIIATNFELYTIIFSQKLAGKQNY